MNLILQAIKSMLRRLTKKVDKNTARIDGFSEDIKTAQATADNAISMATNDMDICGDSDGNWHVKNGSYADLLSKINANIPVKININSADFYNIKQYIPLYIYNNVEDETLDMKLLSADSIKLYIKTGYINKNNVFKMDSTSKPLAFEKGV